MGDIEHAGTSKAMPAIEADDEIATPRTKTARGVTPSRKTERGVAMPRTQTNDQPPPPPSPGDQPVAMPRTKTSEDAGQVAGEIVAEPTVKTTTQQGADKVAAERGMPPIPRTDKP